MKHFFIWLLMLIVVYLIILGSIPASAGAGGSYDLPWWTVDGGGATFSTGGNYSLGGTIGQPDANMLTGGVYTLSGGFWAGGVSIPPEYPLYLPVVLR
jgi:hypothetical protein